MTDPTLSDIAEFTRELRRIGAAIMAGDLHPPGYDEFIARKRDLLGCPDPQHGVKG